MGENRTATSPTNVGPSDPDSDVYRAHHDMSEDGLDVTIAMALERATGMPASETVSDFSRYADPDALNRLFRVPPDEDPLPSGQVTLTIEGYDVRVASDGVIEIELL